MEGVTEPLYLLIMAGSYTSVHVCVCVCVLQTQNCAQQRVSFTVCKLHLSKPALTPDPPKARPG